MALQLTHEVLALRTAHPFGIARGTAREHRVVWVRLTDADGVEGWGEAAPSRYYGESADTVVAALSVIETVLPAEPFALENTDAAMLRVLRGDAAARVAVSAALHDLVGKRLGAPLWKLWGLDPGRVPQTSFTIGLDAPAVVQQKVREAAPYPILKIKVGTPDDEQILRAVREVTDKRLRVDANAGWTAKQALARLPLLEELGVELLEQPVAPDDLRAWRRCTGRRTCRSWPTRRAGPRPTSRAWRAPWTGSTSSSPSAARCAKRCAWWRSRARTAFRSWWAA